MKKKWTISWVGFGWRTWWAVDEAARPWVEYKRWRFGPVQIERWM